MAHFVQTIHHEGNAVDIYWSPEAKRYAGWKRASRDIEATKAAMGAVPAPEAYVHTSVDHVLKHFGFPNDI